MEAEKITQDQFKQKYLESKKIIDQFILNSVFYEFNEQNDKYSSYINHIISINDKQSDYQFDLEIKDQYLYELLKDQYLIVKQCKDMFFKYIKSFNEIKLTGEDKIFLFKLTYFSCLESQRSEMEKLYQPFDDKNLDPIKNIICLIEQLRQINNKLKNNKNNNQDQNEKNEEICYENIHKKIFNPILRDCENKMFESYEVKQKNNILKRIESCYKHEQEFFKDLLTSFEIIGECFKIIEYKQDKQNLYSYVEYSFYRNEFFTDLVHKYQLTHFQFFDKYKTLYIFADPEYILQLNQDETVLYFYVFSVMSLMQVNYLAMNVEQNLCMLINKLNSFEKLKQDHGIIFTMKIIKDLKENDYLDEDLYQLFNEWHKSSDYKVSDSWINKMQIQLYIDGIQSFLKLIIIPEIARFFFKYNSPIPFQISNHQFALSQYLIIGKQFYLNHPDQLINQIEFWKQLIKEQIKFSEIEEKYNYDGKKHNNWKEKERLLQQKCEINKIMCEILESQQYENKLCELYKQIDKFVQMIHCSLYSKIYNKKQLYYTLHSLFIREDIIMPIIIKKLKEKQFYQLRSDASNFYFLILSLKKNFDFRYYNVYKEGQNKVSKTCREVDTLFNRFLNARQQFQDINQNKEETLKLFQDLINEFGFLKNSQFQVFKLNIEFYITQIEIKINLERKEIKERKIEATKETKDIKETQENQNGVLAQSQFLIEVVEHNNQYVVRKRIEEKKNGLEQQIINECSILKTLQNYGTHKNVIQLIDYQTYDGQLELLLEYCEKGSLSQFLSKEDLNKQQKILICIDILEGIQYLHENNILHGDLKLANIVVNKDNIIKIIDFGSCGYQIEKCQLQTLGYKSSDKDQSLFYDYFSIGIILFSVLLQDANFSKQYYYFAKNKTQNKKLLKKYFKERIPNQEQEIKKEYSSCIFKAILSLFNDQPYLRPQLSELIQILKNHNNPQNNIQKDKQINYSIKEAINKLKLENKNSRLVEQVTKDIFSEYELKQQNNEDKVNTKNNYVQQIENKENSNANQNQQVDSQAIEMHKILENEITKIKGNKKKNKILDPEQEKQKSMNKKQTKQTQMQNEEMIEIKLIYELDRNDLYQNLFEYFIKKKDKDKMHHIKLFEVFLSKKIDLRKLQLDLNGCFMQIPQKRSNFLLQSLLVMNKEQKSYLKELLDYQMIGLLKTYLSEKDQQAFDQIFGFIMLMLKFLK